MSGFRNFLTNVRNSIAKNKRARLAPRDVELQPLNQPLEERYSSRWSVCHFHDCILALPDNLIWNSCICASVLIGIIVVALDLDAHELLDIFDSTYNILYGFHVVALAYCFMSDPMASLDLWTSLGFLIDVLTFTHYIVDTSYTANLYKLLCYYLRLHRAFRYFWMLNNYTLKGSVLGTTLKYCYLFLVLRVTFVLCWLYIDELQTQHTEVSSDAASEVKQKRPEDSAAMRSQDQVPYDFLYALYIVNKIFIPIGPSMPPTNDSERIAFLVVMITGCLVVTGAAVASLSLVISVYLRPEETFRTRYRLIMKKMESSNVPPSLRAKVETFYKMYWHKQRAVSATQLLPIFPHSLSSTIYTDIYFKATQRSLMLRDLSYEFLSELAKKMETIHYIPGDAIIKRNDKKSSIIYITSGDIEMLTAEDDSTAMLRMIRGTVLSPCGGSPIAGCSRAYVEIRAATFCTAHVLRCSDLWKTVNKYGKENGQGATVLGYFYEHFEKIKRHYFRRRFPEEAKYKSSILHFKRNLMNIKESKDAAGNQQLAETDVMIEIAGCYIMRNRADSSLTDEADAICLRPTLPCILQPNSSLQVVWNTFVTCLILTVCITHPYYLVYKKHVPVEFRFYDYVVTVIYILDLIVHLSTGANVEDGVPITLAQTSSQQARSKWFVLDVLGTLPIFEFIHDGHFAGLNKLLRLPKVFRMLKMVEDDCVYYSNVLRFFSYSLLFLMSCYLLAAVQQGFMCFQFGYCLVSNFTHSPFWEKEGLDEETIESRVTFGLYWALSMLTFTSHIETWAARDWNYVLYTIFVLEICTVLYIFIQAVYSATIMVTTALREDFDSCMDNVTKFLVRNDVDPVLRDRFKEYLQLCWYTDKGYSMTNKRRSIFYDLPPHVYQDIVARKRSKFILCVPFMKLLHKEDLKNISSKAILFCTSPNEILLNTGDMCNEIYIIKRGICEILSPETRDVVDELSVRSHFGVLECLLRIPTYYTVRAVTHVEIFTISRKHLVNLINIPQIKEALDYCKEQPQYARFQIRREPFVAYHPVKPAPNMEKFHYPRKYEQDNAFLQPFYRLGIFSVLRYIFPRFTIRPDGQYLVRMEWFRASCAFMSAMVYPGYTYLVLQWPLLYFFTCLLDLTAYFDILQRMLVGYYDEQSILVYHPASTAAHYLRGAFLVDLFGCLPLEKLESSWKETYHGAYREAPTKQFLMLNRLIQLYRMPSALLGLNGLVRRDILLVIRACPIFLALLNVLTCFVVYSSVQIFFTTNGENGSWFIVPTDDKGGSWIKHFHKAYRFNITETPWNLHLGSLFWVVYETTTTGYNTFKPTNFNLMRVLIIGMIIGAIITTYFSVRIISTRSNVNQVLASFQDNLKDISVFMKRENLDTQLQKQVNEYYEFNWDRMGGIDFRNVFKMCSQITLRTDAILHIYGPTFTKCPILNQSDVSLLRIIGRAVESFYFLKDTTIIEQDDVVADIYFVARGTVEIKQNEDEDGRVTLIKGSIFGNLEESSTIRSPMSIKTTSQAHLLQINSRDFFSIISEFPSVLKLLHSYRPSKEKYIQGIASFVPLSIKERSTTSPLLFRSKRVMNSVNVKQWLIRIYLIIISLSVIYADVFNAGFQDNRPMFIMYLYFLDFCFLWKFFFQYKTPPIVGFDEDVYKTLIKNRKSYMKGEFKYDLISCLPIEVLCFIGKSNQGMAFSWLRLNRMFRIVTIYKCIQQQTKSISINLTVTTIVTVLIWFSLFVHVCACLWYFIAICEDASQPRTSWIYNNAGQPWCESCYVSSMYFVLTTFTQDGVGDIMPKKQAEVAFVSVLQLVSVMMYMIYVGELSNIIQYKSFRAFKFYSKHLELQEFLKNNRVSKNLVAVVNKYSLHLWRNSRGLQLPHFLVTAPNCLKLKIMSAAYQHHLTNNILFKDCEPAFLRQLVGFMKLYTYTEHMFVVKEREITDSMYIIHTGRVREICKNCNKSRSYHGGEIFGQLQGLLHDLPYTHSYVTTTKSQVLTLNLKDWADLLKHFPISRNAIYKHIESYGDEDFYGDDKKGPKGYPFRSDDQPSSSPTTEPSPSRSSPSPSVQMDSVRKERSGVFLPPPGTSQTFIRSQSIDKSYLWPTHTRHSNINLNSASITSEPLRKNNIETSKDENEMTQKLTDTKYTQSIISAKRKLSSESVAPSTSKKATVTENVSEHIISDESFTLEKQDKKHEEEQQRQKSPSELKSVEDYIEEQKRRGAQSWLDNKISSKSSTQRFKGITPSITFKKRKAHVRYDEPKPVTPPVETHELKPIRDLTAEERNLRSLDSDMPPSPKPEEKVTKIPSTESSSESDSSVKRDK
ncbi:uncharacterized protein LOC123867397 [Maniola jurtina]|uniref:uncharacterized protein LOC123867397 n=1 Tax=Maniola jurtina TaxID=191418 RepID=UPI001E68C643|nr:uncharacterized protein LOC123867397 [Maniola jurtina]